MSEDNNILEIGDDKRIEVTTSRSTPFSDSTVQDLDDVKLTVTDPEGTKVVDSESMTKNATGEYYYIFQTDVDDPTGVYTFEIVGEYGVNDEKEVREVRYR